MASETTGQRIAQRRKLLNLSQEALGDQLEVSRQAVSKWEADAALPEIDKLVAMSRLFGVSVGWLLGVEESQAEPEAPQVPSRHPKWLVPLAAVCTAAALILAGVSMYRAHTLEQRLEKQTAALEAYRAGIEELTAGTEVVSDFDFACTPWQNLSGADFVFTGIPFRYMEDSTCELVVYLKNEETVRTPCDWDGHRYTGTFSLGAADGYECYLVLTDAYGNQWQRNITTESLGKLARNLSAEYMVDVDLAGISQTRTSLTLREITFQVNLPKAFQDTPELWKKFDLVLTCNGEEIGRIDLLNRSQYSAVIDFAGADVSFTTQKQCFDLPESITSGDALVLNLECGFSTGHAFTYEIRAWTSE